MHYHVSMLMLSITSANCSTYVSAPRKFCKTKYAGNFTNLKEAESLSTPQAHLPKAAITAIPAQSATIPTVAFSFPALAMSPRTQSPAHISTHPTHTNTPALTAFKVAIANNVALSFPLKLFLTPSPIAIPMGVITVKAAARMYVTRVEMEIVAAR